MQGGLFMRFKKGLILLICITVVFGINSYETTAASEQNIEKETITADDFTVNCFKFGQGEKTLVILPGLSVQGVFGLAEQVASAYEVLTDDFTVYVFDPRNELPESYSIAEMAEDTAAAFQSMGLDHVYVMGASMGGMTAMELAVLHPELIEKIVLASSAVRMNDARYQTLDEWIRLAREGDAQALYLAFGEAVYPEEIFEQSRGLLTEASETVTEDELQRFVILAESMRDFDITDELDMITCPILAMNDQDDHVLGAEAAAEMEQYMSKRSDWSFCLYEGFGHAFYDTAPDFKERISEFYHALP